MDVSHAILFLENADFVRITGLYFPAKFESYNLIHIFRFKRMLLRVRGSIGI